MKKIFTLPNLFVVLWGLYFTQGTILPIGSVWSRLTLVLYLLISVVCVFVTYFKFKSGLYFKALGLLLAVFTVYGLFGAVDGVDYLKSIYLSLLPTYACFVFFVKGRVDLKWVCATFFFMFAVVVVQYMMAVRLNEETFVDAEAHVINVGYELLSLIPLMFFWKKWPLVQYVMLAVVMALLLSTVKRGAILIGIVVAIYFLYTSVHVSSRKVKWYVWLLSAVFLVVTLKYMIDYYENNQLFQMRIEKTISGDSSGRDSLFVGAWRMFLNSNLLQVLFGHGAGSTYNLLGNYAHNDWLEILVNQGLLGVVIYLCYWVCFYKTYKMDKNKETHQILGSIVIIYFLATFFSMSYMGMTLPSSISLGYCLANGNKEQVALENGTKYKNFDK